MENSLEFVLELKRALSSSDLSGYIKQLKSQDYSVWIKSDVYLQTVCFEVRIHEIKKYIYQKSTA